MEFREILSDYLICNNLTQTQFASLIGVKQSQVSEWLKGKAKPGYDIMCSILSNTSRSAEYWFDL